MQESQNFSLDTYHHITEDDIQVLFFPFHRGDHIFLIGDLGSGKSTLVRALLRDYFKDPDLVVRSPTYTYYQKYGENIYHFDLYRVESKEDLFLIGALDILNNPDNICLIEWPEILDGIIQPSVIISISPNVEGGRNYMREIRKELDPTIK